MSVAISVLALALWLIFYAIKWGSKRLHAAKQKSEAVRVSGIRKDEAITEVVGGCTSKIDDSELGALRNQVKAALDAGDMETAEKLLSILKKTTPSVT